MHSDHRPAPSLYAQVGDYTNFEIILSDSLGVELKLRWNDKYTRIFSIVDYYELIYLRGAGLAQAV
jgi:hypothetical protein